MTNTTIDPISYNAGIEAAARAIADELVELCEAGARKAKQTGDTFVLERQKLSTFIRATLTQHLHRTEPQTAPDEIEAAPRWRAFQGAMDRKLWGIESNDPKQIESGEEIVVPARLSEDDARLIVRLHESASLPETGIVPFEAVADQPLLNHILDQKLRYQSVNLSFAQADQVIALIDGAIDNAIKAKLSSLSDGDAERLALADRLENHVRSRLPGSEPVIQNGAWQMMLDAAKLLRAGGWREDMENERHGFIVSSADETRFRFWDAMGPTWTTDRVRALRFARRIDAERFAAEDEDAWKILEVVPSAPKNTGG